MARRRAIDRVRRRQAYDRAEMRFRISTDTGTQHLASEDVEEQAAISGNAAMFAGLISKLPEAQQQMVRMTFYQGLSQREIARETGIPLGAVKTRLELGVKKIRAAVCSMGIRDEWLGWQQPAKLLFSALPVFFRFALRLALFSPKPGITYIRLTREERFPVNTICSQFSESSLSFFGRSALPFMLPVA